MVKSLALVASKEQMRKKTGSGVQDSTNSEDEWAVKIEAIAVNQDKSAYAEVFHYFAPKIKSFLQLGYEGTINAEQAEDLLQEVMVKVWRKASSYKSDKAKVSTWLYTIARNTRIDALRRNTALDNSVSTDDIWYEQESPETPFLTLQQQRTKSFVTEKLQHLHEDQRQVLFKVYMEGKSHSEIAQDLDIPLGTVKSRVRLAMKKLAIHVDK